MNASTHQLSPQELAIARAIWCALRHGSPDAHDQLNNATEKIRSIILLALTEAIAQRETKLDPFGDCPNDSPSVSP